MYTRAPIRQILFDLFLSSKLKLRWTWIFRSIFYICLNRVSIFVHLIFVVTKPKEIGNQNRKFLVIQCVSSLLARKNNANIKKNTTIYTHEKSFAQMEIQVKWCVIYCICKEMDTYLMCSIRFMLQKEIAQSHCSMVASVPKAGIWDNQPKKQNTSQPTYGFDMREEEKQQQRNGQYCYHFFFHLMF